MDHIATDVGDVDENARAAIGEGRDQCTAKSTPTQDKEADPERYEKLRARFSRQRRLISEGRNCNNRKLTKRSTCDPLREDNALSSQTSGEDNEDDLYADDMVSLDESVSLIRQVSFSGDDSSYDERSVFNLMTTSTSVIGLHPRNTTPRDIEDSTTVIEDNGKTDLHFACMIGDTGTVRSLRDRMGREEFNKLVLVQDRDDHTALHYACLMNELSVVKLFTELLDTETFNDLVCLETDSHRNALHIVCMLRRSEMFSELFDNVSDDVFDWLVWTADADGKTAFHYACMGCMSEVVKISLERLEDESAVDNISKIDSQGKNAFHLACLCGAGELLGNVIERIQKVDKQVDVLDKLVRTTDVDGRTCLHLACSAGHANVVHNFLCVLDHQLVTELFKAKDSNTKTAMDLAASHKQYEVITLIASIPILAVSLLKLMSNDVVVEACERGSNETVLSILTAVEQADPKNELLRKYLNTRDPDGSTVLHIASKRGDKDLTKGVLNTIGKLKRDQCAQLLCATDAKCRTALHESCQQGDNQIVRMLLDEAGKHKCTKDLLCSKDPHKGSAVFVAFENHNYNNIKIMLDQAAMQEINCVKKILCCTNTEKQTVFHRACQGQYDNIRSVEAVVSAAIKDQCLLDVLRKKDVAGKTFLSYIEGAKSEVVQLLIRAVIGQHPSAPSTQRHIYYFLTDTDDNNKNVMMYAQESGCSKELTAFFDPLSKKVIANNPCDFHLFHNTNKNRDFGLNHSSSLLTHMGRSECLSLIKHKYTKAYLDLCWHRFALPFFITTFAMYILLLTSLSLYVLSHDPVVSVGNITSSYRTYPIFQMVDWSMICQYVLIVCATLTLISEVVQMVTKGGLYWARIDNYADLFVCFGSLAISIMPLFAEYSSWHHQLGTSTMCVAWLNAAWMMTKISFGWFQAINLRFIMLFRVIKVVCVFVPVFAIFVLTFALAFNSLFRNQTTFRNIGYSIIKILVMTAGEFDFDDMLCSDADCQDSPYFVLGCILFVIFLGVMTISAMNLLIGVAVGDINELRKRSQVLAFQSQVELVIESQAVAALFTKCN